MVCEGVAGRPFDLLAIDEVPGGESQQHRQEGPDRREFPSLPPGETSETWEIVFKAGWKPPHITGLG